MSKNFTTYFTTNFYHKLLPHTTIIIGVSISTTTPLFVPIQQFFNFTTNFTTHFYHIFLPQILPQTTTTNHYHNWGVNIYYHTNFCYNPNFFSILPHILPQILPQTTTTISTDPPQRFLYLRRTHTIVLRGLQRFVLHPIRLSLGRK